MFLSWWDYKVNKNHFTMCEMIQPVDKQIRQKAKK